MKRIAEKSLFNWLKSYNRKPIILHGARQVGKSTLVRLFAKQANLDLIEINLERYLYLNDIFKTQNIDRIFKEISGISQKNIHEKSLLFLDEIQATPNAITSLRYIHEDMPALPVISAGSLLEFSLKDNNFSMPVGRVDYRYLGPMTFCEYLLNLYPDLLEYLSKSYFNEDVPDYIHLKLIEKFKEYLFIGGMPEAVLAYNETKNLKEVFSIHRSICDTYMDDFSKYAKQRELLLLQNIFRSIPMNVGQKVKYSNYSRDHRSSDIRNCIELLIKAKICNPVYSSDCSGIPLEATRSTLSYKLIFLDVGLMNYMCGINLQNIISLEDNSLINKGQIAEQFIGQHLIFSKDMKKSFNLNYWLRENKKANAEVDFVTVLNNKIVPIEVKSGKSGSLKSLQQFIYHKKVNFSIRFDLNKQSKQSVINIIKTEKGNRNISFDILSLPLYAVELLDDIKD